MGTTVKLSFDNDLPSPEAIENLEDEFFGSLLTVPGASHALVAYEPIRKDLLRVTSIQIRIVDEVWTDEAGRSAAFLTGSSGAARGVAVSTGAPPHSQIVELADQVQEFVVEELWLAGASASWPECPFHPRGHPLLAQVRSARACWTCPVTGAVVSEIGRLVTVP